MLHKQKDLEMINQMHYKPITACQSVRAVFKKISLYHRGKLLIIFVILLLYFIISHIYYNNKTNQTTPTITGNVEAFFAQKHDRSHCELTEGKEVMVILILDEGTSFEEIEAIDDTWSNAINKEDLLFILSGREQIDTQRMHKFCVIKNRDHITLYSLMFKYIEGLKLWDTYSWFFLLRSTSVYVRLENLVNAIQGIDPSQMVMLGIRSSPNQSLCALEHGVVVSHYFIRVLAACMREGNTLENCSFALGVHCDSEILNSIFSTEVSHMSNLLSRNPQQTNPIMSDVILLNTPLPNDIFHLVDTASYQEEYFQVKDEIEELGKIEQKCLQMLNQKTERIETSTEYIDSHLYRDVWMSINGNTLISKHSDKPENIHREYQKEIHKLAEIIYDEHKYEIGYANYSNLNLREIIIHHSFESRDYYFTGFVENIFPDYRYVLLWKKQLRNANGIIRSITPLNSVRKVVKIAIILITTQNTLFHSINKFSKNLNEMNEKINFEYFVIKVEQSENQTSEKSILIHLMKEKLSEYIILLCTNPEISVTAEVLEFASVMTIQGHQIYTPGPGLISIHSNDVFQVHTGLWTHCKVTEMIECIKKAIEKYTRLVVLELD